MINESPNLALSKARITYFAGLPNSLVDEIEQRVSAQSKAPMHVVKYTPQPGKDMTYGLDLPKSGERHLGCFVLDSRLNDLRYVNKFFETVNGSLRPGGVFMGRLETSGQRRSRQMGKFFWPLNVLYCSLDYLVWRVWPKLPKLRRIYFNLTKGRNRVLSKIETFGRLYSCGFKLLHSFTHDGQLYFIAQKVKDPDFNLDPTYGPLIRLRRVGRGGKTMVVYKLRTMYPYSEYLQEYFYEQKGLQEGGKLKDDPRVNEAGRILRKYWLDELPMLYNLFSGDCKIVGVRPISWHYFSLYPKEFQEYRKNFKPGLIPPVYVEIPKDLDDVVRIEREYLEAYEKAPLLTDCKYIFMMFYNVLFRKVRSN